MDLGKSINVIYAVAAWIVMFSVMDAKRIKRLAPIGLLAVVLLFAGQEVFMSLGMLKYQKGFFLIMGIPLFQFFWAFAYSILLVNFIKEEWFKKLPVIFLFTLISELLVYAAELTGSLQLLQGYNVLYDTAFTFVAFSFGIWCAEGLFKDRIHGFSKGYS